MKTLYRACFEIRPTGEEDLFVDVSNHCWNWILDRRGISKDWKKQRPGPANQSRVEAGKAMWVEALQLECEDSRMWAFQFAHPDAYSPQLNWVSEGGIRVTGEGTLYFSLNIKVTRLGGGMIPVQRQVGSPRVIRELTRSYACFGTFRLPHGPITVKKPDEIEGFIQLLTDNRRIHPVILISPHIQSSRPVVDPVYLANQTAGLAHTIYAKSQEFCRELSRRFPPALTCFDGAVRLYWPGFSRADGPRRHPLWMTEQLMEWTYQGNHVFLNNLLELLCSAATVVEPDHFLSWQRIHEIARRQALEEAKKAGDKDELIEILEEDNTDKMARIQQLEAESEQQKQEIAKLRSRTQSLEVALESRKSGDDAAIAAAEKQIPVESVQDAIRRARSRWGEGLVFVFNSKSDEYFPFQPAEEVLAAFEWLAERYLLCRNKEIRISNMNEDLRERLPRWEFSPHQAKVTRGMFSEWYETQYQGKTYKIHAHLKCGISRNPKESIRIAFCYEPDEQKIIIGYIGQHQRNTKS